MVWMLTSNLGQSSFWRKPQLDLFQKNYKRLAIPYFLFPKCGFLSSSTQIWRNVIHDVLLDTKVVPMNGKDWDIIPKFTYPMQSNFEQFMCSLDRNPKFSPFEGMTLALQAHLFNTLYHTSDSLMVCTMFPSHMCPHYKPYDQYILWGGPELTWYVGNIQKMKSPWGITNGAPCTWKGSGSPKGTREQCVTSSFTTSHAYIYYVVRGWSEGSCSCMCYNRQGACTIIMPS
jgi:hypothetical protein